MFTETAVKAARPATKPRKLYDEKGLFLLDDWLSKHIGSIPVRQVTAADILAVCRPRSKRQA